jgi:hypothetical protein
MRGILEIEKREQVNNFTQYHLEIIIRAKKTKER